MAAVADLAAQRQGPRGRRPFAQGALEAADRQHTALPGGKITAQVMHTLVKEVMGLNEQLAEIDKVTAARFASTPRLSDREYARASTR